MKIVVDRELCQGHGQCEFAAPEVFSVQEDGTVAYDEQPPESQRANVENAVRRCPVRAISLVED
ncbi:MAG TPA: ferredoxin [Acidimicrobiia bacterium]|nr:ferredoxin [Acidimicrobiia bacterium]